MGASLQKNQLRRLAKSCYIRRISHELRLVARIDYHTIHPAGVPQLGTSQQHLMWTNGGFCRRRSEVWGRKVEGTIIRIQR